MGTLKQSGYRWALLMTIPATIALCLHLIASRFCVSSFGAIRIGMTTDDVDEIQRRPPDIVDGGDSRVDALWIEPDGSKIIVTFDGEGRVIDTELLESNLPFYDRAWVFVRQPPWRYQAKSLSDDWWLQWK